MSSYAADVYRTTWLLHSLHAQAQQQLYQHNRQHQQQHQQLLQQLGQFGLASYPPLFARHSAPVTGSSPSKASHVPDTPPTVTAKKAVIWSPALDVDTEKSSAASVARTTSCDVIKPEADVKSPLSADAATLNDHASMIAAEYRKLIQDRTADFRFSRPQWCQMYPFSRFKLGLHGFGN